MPRFRAKPLEFEAVQLRQPIEIRAGKGRPVVHGQPGDWLRSFDEGGQDIITDAQLAAGFERVNGAIAPVATVVEPRRDRFPAAPVVAPPPTKRPSKLTDAQWADARRRWEAGEAVSAIAESFDVTAAAIRQRAARDQWPKRAPANGKQPAAPKGTKLGGRVRCTSCDLWTEFDPCSNCHKPLKKKWT